MTQATKGQHGSTCLAVAEECAIENIAEWKFGHSVALSNAEYNEVADYVRDNHLVEQYLSDGTSTCYCD